MACRFYKGFIITTRSFQVRGTGAWTTDFLIGRRGSLRAFSTEQLHPTEPVATSACWQLACRIIDANERDASVDDLAFNET